VDGVQHAVRYVDQTSISSSEPPRGSAMVVLGVCLILALLTILRIVGEDFSVAIGWFILVACAVVILIAGYIAFVDKGKHILTIRFKNGESTQVVTDNASRISQLQSAVHDALDHLDYHDTDQAKPTVVLASLEPTKLTAVSGPAASVVKINDETVRDMVNEIGDSNNKETP